MIRALTIALAVATPALAQDHSGHAMPGMTMPMPAAKPARRPAPRRTVVRPAPAADPHAGHAMPAPAADPHAGHDMSAMPVTAAPAGTALPAGDAPAPAPPADHYADRDFPAAAMARARAVMMDDEGGGQSFSLVMLNIAERQVRRGRDGWRWDGEAWFGGDIDRLTIKTEGEAEAGRRPAAAEVQALWSRAIGPYFNLQAGLRHNVRPAPDRTYAAIGVEGLAPYWFDVEAAAFLSDKGDLLGRMEGWYDQRLTQRLILQPRIELNLAAQDVRAQGIGSGLSSASIDLRLRYEITRQFAPYVGVSHEAKTGRTADFARAAGDDPVSTSFVAGVRLWF